MITFDLYTGHESDLYSVWLRGQSEETLRSYFGIRPSENMLDDLIRRISKNPWEHNFIVALDNKRPVGVVHMASGDRTIELGIMVLESERGKGIGDQLIDRAITWSRNRGYQELYMHCLKHNEPVKNLCRKHGLEMTNEAGEGEVRMPLRPASWLSIGKEISDCQKNLFRMLLQNGFTYHEIYG